MPMEVKVVLGQGYIPTLESRMRRHRITQAELAAEMEPPVSASQASRWFTKNEARRVEPEMRTVERIETAMARIIKRRSRRSY